MMRHVDAPAPLQHRLGGAAAVEAMVDDFYRRVQEDDALAAVFARVDMVALRRHQAQFLGFALGTVEPEVGERMRVAHAGLEITPRQFTAVARHLAEALRAGGVEAALVNEIGGNVERLREEIVGR